MHLSLSLSLCSQFASAQNGALHDLLAGPSCASERGFRAVCHRPLAAPGAVPSRLHASLACACVDHSLGCPPYNPWRISEEAPSRVPSRAGSVGPKRRGPFPNRGPRRSLLATSVQGEVLERGLFERHVPLVPIGVVAFEEAPSRAPTRAGYSGRRGPDLGPRHSPIAGARFRVHAVAARELVRPGSQVGLESLGRDEVRVLRRPHNRTCITSTKETR